MNDLSRRPVIPIVPAHPVGSSAEARVYAKSVSGRFNRLRWAMVLLTQLVFYGAPWLQWNGRQAVLFDLAERRFNVFGLVLQPQDFIYLAALLVICALGLFFVTALAGRVWCGYACPQSVYTMVFMALERRFEGDRAARMKLDAAPWSAAKLARKAGKHAAWIVFALATGFSFVAYFTPVRPLAQSLAAFALSPWEWFWLLFYAGATWGNAGFLRSAVCKYMCPYARFQSALIDRDSLIIGYDTVRGEPRGSRSRKADPAVLGLGSCIDCTLCVQVCPTGIDIRKGLQNECIGCAACIDVCDDVMGKMGYAPGLIRYATENGVAGSWQRARMLRRAVRPRTLIYGGLLLAAGAAFALGLAGRSALQVDVIKDRGVLARIDGDGRIENVYRLQLINKREQAQRVSLRVEGLPGLKLADAGESLEWVVPPVGLSQAVVRLLLPLEAAQGLVPGAQPVRFEFESRVDDGGDPTVGRTSERTTFFVPR